MIIFQEGENKILNLCVVLQRFFKRIIIHGFTLKLESDIKASFIMKKTYGNDDGKHTIVN